MKPSRFGTCRNGADSGRGRFVGSIVVSSDPAQSRMGIAGFAASFWTALETCIPL